MNRSFSDMDDELSPEEILMREKAIEINNMRLITGHYISIQDERCNENQFIHQYHNRAYIVTYNDDGSITEELLNRDNFMK